MDIHHFKLVYLLSQQMNMSAVAKDLGITQSAISQTIKQVENEIGGELFERRNRALFLTPLGQDFAKQAEKVVQAYNDAMELVGLYEDRKEFHIGMCNPLGEFLADKIIMRLQECFPNTKFTYEINIDGELISHFKQGDLDVILTNTEFEEKGYHCELICTGDIVAVCKPGTHPKAMTLQELSHERLIVGAKGTGIRTFVEPEFHKQGYSVVPFVESASYPAICELAERNVGVAIVPRAYVAPAVKAGKLDIIETMNGNMTRSYYLVCNEHIRADQNFVKCRKILMENIRDHEREMPAFKSSKAQ